MRSPAGARVRANNDAGEQMLGTAVRRSLGLCLLIAPSLLTAAVAAYEPQEPEAIPNIQVAYSAAPAYLAPDERTPSPTGILKADIDAREGETLGSDWVALRSPARSKEGAPSYRRSGLSPSGLKRWKGSNTRGRPLADLEMQVARFGIQDWVYPIDEKLIAGSPYGKRRHPITGGYRDHHGQDIGCRRGTPIYAAADGLVSHSKGSRTAGRYIEIAHREHKGRMVRTRYLHLSRRLVQKGEWVRMGQLIGRCGSTGQSLSPHLHFEVWTGHVPRRPFRVYRQVLKSEEAEKRSWDEAIERAIAENSLRELIEAPDVPFEVRNLVRDYLRSSKAEKIDRLAADVSPVTASN